MRFLLKDKDAIINEKHFGFFLKENRIAENYWYITNTDQYKNINEYIKNNSLVVIFSQNFHQE